MYAPTGARRAGSCRSATRIRVANGPTTTTTTTTATVRAKAAGGSVQNPAT